MYLIINRKIVLLFLFIFSIFRIYPDVSARKLKAIKQIESKIKLNQNVKSVTCLDLYGDLTDKWEFLIETKSDCTIVIYDIKKNLKNNEIKVYSVNDLYATGGKCEVKGKNSVYSSRSLFSLSEITGIKLNNINDVINNCDAIYKVFKTQFENDNRPIETEKYLIKLYVYKIKN